MNKFYEIYLDIKEKIESGFYPAGQSLPSEHQMSQDYGVSRETLRKALLTLLENGYIQKQQGKGSIVLDIHRYNFPVSGLTSFKELQESQALHSESIVVVNKKIKATKLLDDDELLDADEMVIYLIRQRLVDDEVIILDKDYIRCSIIEDLPTPKIDISLYVYIEHDLGMQIAYAKKEFTVDRVTKEDKKYMDLNSDTHVVVVRSDVFLEDTRFFQYTESRHRLDRFKFVEFARRNKV